MNGTDEVIESKLRTALRDAADQIDVRPTTATPTADELVVRRRATRRAPMVVAIAACLVVVLVVGGALLLSAGRDPSSVQTPAGALGGCPGKAYVVDAGNGDGNGAVFAITTATGEVSPPIPVSLSTGGGAVSAAAITPDGKHAYVTHGDHNTVLVIDTATGALSATIPVGGGPLDVAITPDGKHAYVTNRDDGTVSVIDTATGVVSATVDVGGAVGVAMTPDGKYAYVTGGGDKVSVIDTAAGVVSASIDIGWPTTGVAITPDGRHAYVAGDGTGDGTLFQGVPVPGTGPGAVSVIDTATGVVSATIPVGVLPWGVAITPDGTHAYVVDHNDNAVSVIDTASGVVSATINLGKGAQEVAITPDGKYAYVTGPDESSYLPGPEDPLGRPDPIPIHGTVSVIDIATGVVSANIPTGKNPFGVAICPS